MLFPFLSHLSLFDQFLLTCYDISYNPTDTAVEAAANKRKTGHDMEISFSQITEASSGANLIKVEFETDDATARAKKEEELLKERYSDMEKRLNSMLLPLYLQY